MTPRTFQSIGAKSLIAVSSLAVLLALGACGKKDDSTTAGQKLDAAVAKTEQAATDAKNDVKAAVASTEASAKDMSANSGTTVKDTTANIKADVKDAGAKIAEKFDDATITATVKGGLAKDSDLSALKINVDTKDGVVTLNGPAPTTAARDRATEIAKAVKGVSSVNNNLAVKAG